MKLKNWNFPSKPVTWIIYLLGFRLQTFCFSLHIDLKIANICLGTLVTVKNLQILQTKHLYCNPWNIKIGTSPSDAVTWIIFLTLDFKLPVSHHIKCWQCNSHSTTIFNILEYTYIHFFFFYILPEPYLPIFSHKDFDHTPIIIGIHFYSCG